MAKKELSQAAEKVAAAEKKNEKKPANPNGNFFVRAGKAIKKFCKDLKGEIKKIVWPDAKTVLKSTGVVLAVVIICALVIGGIDWLLSQGLSLLDGPGNDIVAVTNLMAVGCHMILFTTGRGTPLGSAVPTLKIATNHELALKKASWIDLDASMTLDGNEMTDELLALVLRTANGEKAKNEINCCEEISIFKDGVTL